jgi:uncharacterized protein YgiM (DUF1202 family)
MITGLRLRSGPSLSAEVRARLNKGDAVTVLDKSTFTATADGLTDHWYEVTNSSGIRGWVFGGYLDLEGSSGARVPDDWKTGSLSDYGITFQYPPHYTLDNLSGRQIWLTRERDGAPDIILHVIDSSAPGRAPDYAQQVTKRRFEDLAVSLFRFGCVAEGSEVAADCELDRWTPVRTSQGLKGGRFYLRRMETRTGGTPKTKVLPYPFYALDLSARGLRTVLGIYDYRAGLDKNPRQKADVLKNIMESVRRGSP